MTRLNLGMTIGRGGDGFRYLILIPIEKIYPHPNTQTQWVLNFYLIFHLHRVTGIFSYLYTYRFSYCFSIN